MAARRSEGGGHLVGSFGDGDEPQMAIPPGQGVVAVEGSEHGDAEGLEGLAQEDLVAGRPDLVEHHPAHSEVRLESGEAVDQGGH